MARLQNLIHPTDGRLVATGLKPGAEAQMVKALQEARLGVELRLEDQRADYSEYGAGNSGCDQCGRDMNPAERLLGPVCGKCCRKNHKEATR